MNHTVIDIVARSDDGQDPAQIAAALGVSRSWVYKTLRAERPRRKRKARIATSQKRVQIVGLRAQGIKPVRIAQLLGCTRAYVYRVLSE
jgi:DNA invertase Pin-like site-specific DNA recombinase